jgi:uncharacterized protein (DUF1697 family)
VPERLFWFILATENYQRRETMPVFVSLFRAINVGGNAKVSMAALKELHESLGLTNVVTYLQTGNVVFDSPDPALDPGQLAARLSREFEKKFGFPTAVMVRTAAELDEVFNKNPFREQPEKPPKWIVVLFLADRPTEPAIADLLKSYTGPEEIQVIGREMYAYYSNGIGTSKLSNSLIEKKLKTSGTGRNWNTVTKLLEMTRR